MSTHPFVAAMMEGEPPPVDTSKPLNPVDIETAIRECSDRIHKGVYEVTRRESIARAARRDYDRAYAMAYQQHDGPAHEKRYGAEVATQEERKAAEDAEIAFRYAERTAKALEAQMRALQSIGASVRLMYGAQQ